jgi:alpha-galactosidase
MVLGEPSFAMRLLIGPLFGKNQPDLSFQDSWNAYAFDYNETTILTNAGRLVDLGFRDLGYQVVIFDDAMTELNRSATGSLLENAAKFPSGLKSIADSLHADGLLFGVYSSAGKFSESF